MEEDFYQALKEFLFNGRCYRRDVVPGLLIMLRGLRDVIRQQDSFRFFTSSLLIVYDGARREEMEENKAEEDWYCSSREGGIRNSHDATVAKAVDCTGQVEPVQPDNSGRDLQRLRKQVDVRMIDFANSTHLGMPDQSTYPGPDEGYIQGLTTLINAYESILKSI